VTADLGGYLAGKAFGKDAGAFSADSVAGGLIRGTFGDQSPGELARQGVGSLLGHGTAANIVGGVADVGVNLANLKGDLGATVGRGIDSESAAISSGIANGQGVVGHALNTAGHATGQFLDNTASMVGSGIVSGVGAVGHAITHNPVASAVGSLSSW
jgi:hypothetical protein